MDNTEKMRQAIVEWSTERLRRSGPAFEKEELERERATLIHRRDQVNARLSEIEVTINLCDLLMNDNISETDVLKFEAANRCNLALIQNKGE